LWVGIGREACNPVHEDVIVVKAGGGWIGSLGRHCALRDGLVLVERLAQRVEIA
jgi:hypothetical protein